MEVKKSKKANLQDKRLLFLEIGFIVTLLVMLLAFEWSTKEAPESVLNIDDRPIEVVEEMIAIQPDEPPPPAEAPRPAAILTDEFIVVDDDVKINTDIILSTEDDKSIIEIKDYVPEARGEEVIDEPIPFAVVEDKPMFMGGDENEFTKWIGTKMVYPESARDNNVSGKVWVQFTVSATGDMKDVKVLRSLDPALDKEAIRVVSMSPKWTPGKQRGKAVPVTYQFPVTFRLL